MSENLEKSDKITQLPKHNAQQLRQSAYGRRRDVANNRSNHAAATGSCSNSSYIYAYAHDGGDCGGDSGGDCGGDSGGSDS